MSLQVQEEDKPVFVPYSFTPGLGNCAEASAKDVNKEQYRDHVTFRAAGILMVRHAP